MKAKEYAHCGFPEVGYSKYAEMMVDMGFKVARIEQTETPQVTNLLGCIQFAHHKMCVLDSVLQMMEERCKKMGRTTKFDKVVRREICQMTSRGTRLAVTGSDADTSYLMAISGN